MSFLSDLKIIYHMAVSSNRGTTHAERLEGFYQGQAGAYDDFRRRLLQGRAELFSSLPIADGGLWLDMGGGTGVSLEFMGDKRARFNTCRVLDLAPSLLKVARERIADRGWDNAEAVEADVTTYAPPEGQADLVTFSYSLTMIPDWFAAIDHAFKLLKPGGYIGVVDFYTARKYPSEGHAQHPWRTRAFWPVWFANDNVFLSPDHVPYLHRLFEPVHFSEHRAKVPYMPLARAPYYQFIGRKP